MRLALVCPYSYSYPGGVVAHVDALAREFLARGHDVRVLAPYDPDDWRATVTHAGTRPRPREAPDYLIPLGRTWGLPANGAVSNLCLFETQMAATLSRELRLGRYDAVHVHEPNAPVAGWYAAEVSRYPLVGTFHAYSTNPVAHGIATLIGARRIYNKLHVKIAVSRAALWTAERFYGGRWRVIPNGIDPSQALTGPKPEHEELRLLFIGRAEERKGLPVLLRAFEALRAVGVATRLVVAGATSQEVEPLLLDGGRGIEVAGRVSEDDKWRLLHEADLVCAPSLRGESFGIVLLEALASGTPVVCSDIAGYRDVVRDGVDGALVPVADAAALGEAVHALGVDPKRRAEMGAAARERAEQFAWPRVADQVMEAYEDAAAAPAPARRPEKAAVRLGLKPADLGPRRPPERIAPLDPPLPGSETTLRRIARRAAMAAVALLTVTLAFLAIRRIGLDSIAHAVVAATPVWVLAALGLMATSLLLRAEAWRAILRAALPAARVRRRDATRGTMIGVMMSATLPARLGEPSRALVIARRLGRVRESLPVVLGTIVSQTLLNLVALAVLGVVMLATIGLFRGHEQALALVSLAPFLMLLTVLFAPALLRRGGTSRYARVRQAVGVLRAALLRVRSGLQVFRNPRLGSWAAVMQLAAWALQWLACYALLAALGLDHQAGVGAAAAVLFAVNVTAVVPATPSNLGVFQAACVAVLSAYGVGHADALAYGIILQAVEVATALALGMPSLLGEGLSWRDLRVRALHAAPVELRLAAQAESGKAAKSEA